jgi:hypothetical protein
MMRERGQVDSPHRSEEERVKPVLTGLILLSRKAPDEALLLQEHDRP